MLQGKRFVRVHPRVWRHRDHQMSFGDHVQAAQLALPEGCHLTGISRLQVLGLEFGPVQPVRFVVKGDLHLALDGVFLHRTKRLPPLDGTGVAPAAAFLAYCARARALDAIKVGDWLLHRKHMTLKEVRNLALADQWRAGGDEALWCLDHLDGASASLKESELRAVLNFAGISPPEVNVSLDESASWPDRR